MAKSKLASREVPRGLADLVAKSAKRLAGKYCYGVPHFGLRTKLKLDLVALGDMDLFAKNNVDGSNHPDWVPLSRLRDTLFLAVNTTAPYPVGM